MTKRLDAFLFDAGGVLVLPDPTVLAPLLAPYGGDTSEETLRRAHYKAMHALDTRGSVHDDWALYNDEYVRVLGVPEHDHAEAVDLLRRTRHPWLWRWPIVDSVLALRELH